MTTFTFDTLYGALAMLEHARHFKCRDVAVLPAEFHRDQVDWLVLGAVFVGVTPRFWGHFHLTSLTELTKR